jgi:hypothetical protein
MACNNFLFASHNILLVGQYRLFLSPAYGVQIATILINCNVLVRIIHFLCSLQIFIDLNVTQKCLWILVLLVSSVEPKLKAHLVVC